METRKLIVILADISGYTRFMLESRTAALHGQIVINGPIESILREVDIPLTPQEIEGDAVFLYAAHPGAERDWQGVTEQVSRQLALDAVALALNTRPRKTLGWRTPAEVLDKYLRSIQKGRIERVATTG